MPKAAATHVDAPTLRTVTEQVADALRQRIRDERLQPGDRLGGEQELAREYGVSRPTMREALRMLSSGGQLRSAKGPSGGTFVERDAIGTLSWALAQRIAAMLDVDAISLAEVLRARTALELPIVRLAAERIDDATLAELREIVARFDAGTDDDERIAANAHLHRTIARAAGNPILEASIDWALDVLEPQLSAELPPSLVDHRHAAIVDALALRDPDAAERTMRAHLERVTAAAEQHGRPHPALSTAGGHGRVALQLQAHIQREGLEPGDRIGREDELAERFGTSRTVLREALHTLSSSHLIRVTRGRGGGIFVANTFADGIGRMVSDSVTELLAWGLVTFDQLFEARIALEPALAGAAARLATPAQVAALGAAILDHAAFHRVLGEIAPDGIVLAITAWMFDAHEPRYADWPGTEAAAAQAVEHHRAIHAAVAAGDAATAEALMRAHLVHLATSEDRPAG